MRLHSAGQLAPSTALPAPAAPVVAPDIGIGPDGKMTGIEPILDQITKSVVDNAGPMIRNQLLPVLQADKAMQREVGRAIGHAIAKHLQLPAWIAAGALATIAAVMVKNAMEKRG